MNRNIKAHNKSLRLPKNLVTRGWTFLWSARYQSIHWRRNLWKWMILSNSTSIINKLEPLDVRKIHPLMTSLSMFLINWWRTKLMRWKKCWAQGGKVHTFPKWIETYTVVLGWCQCLLILFYQRYSGQSRPNPINSTIQI